MGAFLLVADSVNKFNTSAATNTIKQQCLTEPARFVFNGWTLFLFPKALSRCANFIEGESAAVYSTGTPFISGCDPEETLRKKLENLSEGNVASEDLRGLYWILLRNREGLKFITDSHGLYSVYHTASNDVVSSSFLGLCMGLDMLTPDKDSLMENLLTGSLIGRDTLFREVKRFDPWKPAVFSGLEFVPNTVRQAAGIAYRTRADSINNQIEILDQWFCGLKPFVERFGIDAGITGGLDSRLLFAMCRRHFRSEELQFHSHLRREIDKDFKCGREICESSGIKFVATKVKDWEEAGRDSAVMMNDGMLFNDGQIRTHSFWHEGFNTASYRIATLGDKRMGINGIGGEQYRNMERHLFPSRSLAKWVRFEMIDKYCGNKVTGSKTRELLADSISAKISERLGVNKGSLTDLFTIKRYLNEIYNPSNRVLRASHENRLSFFLSPFADPEISSKAYGLTPYLGLSLGYEAELIRKIDPEAASFMSTYGFRFTEREPLSSVIPGLIFNNFLPAGVQSAIIAVAFAGRADKWVKMISEERYLTECLEAVESFALPMNLRELIKRRDLGPLVFAMGHLMITFKDKLAD